MGKNALTSEGIVRRDIAWGGEGGRGDISSQIRIAWMEFSFSK
jgi:hypothetical protein